MSDQRHAQAEARAHVEALRAAGARAEFDVAYMDSQIVKQAKAGTPRQKPKSAVAASPEAQGKIVDAIHGPIVAER